jgi:hypothetical protein
VKIHSCYGRRNAAKFCIDTSILHAIINSPSVTTCVGFSCLKLNLTRKILLETECSKKDYDEVKGLSKQTNIFMSRSKQVLLSGLGSASDPNPYCRSVWFVRARSEKTMGGGGKER